MRWILLALLVFAPGCAFQAQGWGVELAWTIGDASVGCTYDENGYPTGGSDCVVSGSEVVEAIAEASTYYEPVNDGPDDVDLGPDS